MVALEEVRRANAALVQKQPLVAVFAGGTSGIGEFTLRALVRTHAQNKGQGLRVYIVGRNQQKTESIISDCKAIYADGEFTFIKAQDLSLLKDVADVSRRITEAERATSYARIDLLFMTQGGLYWGDRRETAEGLTLPLSTHYYSRAALAHHLLPLLKSSTLPAHIISVFGAGLEKTFNRSDLSLRDPANYSITTGGSQVSYMTTLFFEKLATENGLACVYNFPGLVITPGFDASDHPFWFKAVWKVANPLARLASTGAEECGERILFLGTERFRAAEVGVAELETKGTERRASGPASPRSPVSPSSPRSSSSPRFDAVVAKGSNGKVGSGMYSTDIKGETIDEKKMAKAYGGFDREEAKTQVWEHAMEVFGDIENTGKFVK